MRGVLARHNHTRQGRPWDTPVLHLCRLLASHSTLQQATMSLTPGSHCIEHDGSKG